MDLYLAWTGLVGINPKYIGITGGLNSIDVLEYIFAPIEFSSPPVEAVARHPDNQIIAEFLRPAKEVDVTLVKEVVGAVGYYFGH